MSTGQPTQSRNPTPIPLPLPPPQETAHVSTAPPTPAPASKDRNWIPALVFASILIIFFIVAFFVAPTMTPDQRSILLLLFCLLAGFSTHFLGGEALFKISGNESHGWHVFFSATAGIAVFAVCYFFPPYFFVAIKPPPPIVTEPSPAPAIGESQDSYIVAIGSMPESERAVQFPGFWSKYGDRKISWIAEVVSASRGYQIRPCKDAVRYTYADVDLEKPADFVNYPEGSIVLVKGKIDSIGPGGISIKLATVTKSLEPLPPCP